MEFETILCLSNSHITANMRELLSHMSDRPDFLLLEYGEGVMIHLPADEDCFVDTKHEIISTADIICCMHFGMEKEDEESLGRCMDLAHKVGATWLRLDCDGPVDPDLKTYEKE